MRGAATELSGQKATSPSISDPGILDSICAYGFGVVLEVTNGITNNVKRQEKKRQVRRAKAIIQQMVGEEAKIVGGIALVKTGSLIKDIEELDFLLRVENYSPKLLRYTSQRVLNSGRLDERSGSLLEEIISREKRSNTHSIAEYLQRPRSHPARGTRGKIISPTMQAAKDYHEAVARIKGIMLEEYVKTLFVTSMSPAADYSVATQVTLRSGQHLGNRERCVDIIIATYQTDFLEALHKMEEIYNQKRQRLTVERYEGLDLPLPRDKEKTFKRRPYNSVNDAYRSD